MKAKDIQNILEKQLEQDGLQRIAINGDWGVGKTYQVNEFIRAHKKSKKDKKDKKIKKNEKLEIIKVSLFGKKSVDDINNLIYGEISKCRNVFKEILSIISNISGSYMGVSISLPDLSHLIGNANFKEDQKVLIIFDDFERKSPELSVESIMGYIDNLCANNKSVKVAMIMCEKMYAKKKESEDQLEVFNAFKEKTFNKIFNIDSVDEDTVRDIVEKYAKTNKFSDDISKYMVEHFLMLKSKNLRILEGFLSELSLYKEDGVFADIFKEERNQNNDDALKILINCLVNVVYDCKQNKDSEKNKKEDKQVQQKILSCELNDGDKIHSQILALMPRCQMADVGADAKYNIISIILNKYLFLDNSKDKVLKTYLLEHSNKDNLYESLLYFSDEEAQTRALAQYQDILEKKFLSNLAVVLNDWYENLNPKFIKENIDFQLLEDALVDGAGGRSFCFYETNWVVYRTNNKAKPVLDFIKKYNKRVYCERIRMTCETLENGNQEAFAHIVLYINQYHDQISKDKHLDPEIENCFVRNDFFIKKLEGTIPQDLQETMQGLFDIYRNICSKECTQKFEKVLNREIKNATERTYALRLKYLKNPNN